MRLRTKTFLVVGTVLLVVLVAAALVQRSVVQSGYAKVERHDVGQNADRLERAVQHNMELLAFGTRFNSVWDDAFNDTQSRSKDNLETNDFPAADSYKGYGLSAVIVLDTDGNIVAGGSANGEDSYGPVPASLADKQSLKKLISPADQLDTPICGIWHDASGLLQVCSHPIIHTDGTGPAIGTLVNAKKLDTAAITALATRTQLNLSFPNQSQAKLAKAASGQTPGLGWKAVSNKQIDAVVTLPTLNDNSGAQITIAMPRPVHEQGTKALNLAMITMAIAGVLLVITMIIALSLIVLRRLSSLTETAHDIAETGKLDKRVDAHGKDELADLATTFNRMLDTIKVQDEAIRGAASDVATVLGKVAGGDLRVRMPSGHEGDFQRIEQSINDVLAKLENDFSGVQKSAEDVHSTAMNIGEMREILVGAFDEQIDILQDAQQQMTTLENELKQLRASTAGGQIQTVQGALDNAVGITDANSAVSTIASDATANLTQHAEQLQTIVSHYRISQPKSEPASNSPLEEAVQ